MADNNKREQALAVFGLICETLEDREWKYQKNEEKLSVSCVGAGDDLPIELLIKVLEDRSLVMLLSQLPLTVPEDKSMDFVIALSTINNRLVDGSFDMDLENGRILFRMTNSFLDSCMGKDVFAYMLLCSFLTIDEYNDKLLMLAKGMIDLERFLASLK